MGEIAFGASALVTVEGRAVVLRAPDGAFAERARHELGGRVVAVSLAGDACVALDATGTVTLLDALTGEVQRSLDGGAGALMLAAAPDGSFAVAGPQGVSLSAGGEPVQMDLRGATALALSSGLLAIGGRDGIARVIDVRAASALGACRTGGVVRGIARAGRAPGQTDAPRPYWVASTDRAIVRVEREASEAFELVDTKELELGEIACDPIGALVAVRVGLHKVAIFDLLEGKLRGTITYAQALAGLAFAPAQEDLPATRLAIALAGGSFDVVEIEGAIGREGVATEIRLKSEDITAVLARVRGGEAPSPELRRRPADASAAPKPTRAAILWMIGFMAIIVTLLWLLRP